VLEARFIEALRKIADDRGRPAKVKQAIQGGKSGYRWQFGDEKWMVEPQGKPPPEETAGVQMTIDFVMRSTRPGDERKLAIFLDGWTYHRGRLGLDLRQRMALEASGNWCVWSFTWHDLNAKFGYADAGQTLELAVPDPAAFKAMLQKMGLPGLAQLGYESVFDWFEAELRGGGLRWDEIGQEALAARMTEGRMSDIDRWRKFVAAAAPDVVRGELQAFIPRLVAVDDGSTNQHFRLMAVHDGKSNVAMVCILDDHESLHDETSYKSAWGGYLRLFQLMRRVPNAWFMTRSALTEGPAYSSIAQARGIGAGEAGWLSHGDIEPEFRAVARALEEADVPEPEVGDEIPDERGDVWAMAELEWRDAGLR